MDFLSRFFDMPGNGGIVVLVVIVVLLLSFGLSLRWISKGGRQDL